MKKEMKNKKVIDSSTFKIKIKNILGHKEYLTRKLNINTMIHFSNWVTEKKEAPVTLIYEYPFIIIYNTSNIISDFKIVSKE